MGLEEPQHPEQEPSPAAACEGGVTRTRSPERPHHRGLGWGWGGTDGSPAGPAAGSEGIAAAAGTEAAVGCSASLGTSAEKGLFFFFLKSWWFLICACCELKLSLSSL